MSLSDFCSCTPLEFNETYEAWQRSEERLLRNGWEQTRVMCQSMLQPYSKLKLSAKDVFPLPWDHEAQEEDVETVTDEERAARYAAAKKRYGIE